MHARHSRNITRGRRINQCNNMAADSSAQLLAFRCDASAAQWQVFGELARQLGALTSEWTRVEPPAVAASSAPSASSTSSSPPPASSSSSSSSFWAAWHLWIADRGALPWAALNALPPLGARTRRLVNYFRGFTELTMKARMARNIIAHCADRRTDAFAHMPVSFIVQPGEGAGHAERIRFAEYETQSSPTSTSVCNPEGPSAESVNIDHRPKWIAKSTHGAKGENICIRDNVADILAYVDSFAPPPPPPLPAAPLESVVSDVACPLADSPSASTSSASLSAFAPLPPRRPLKTAKTPAAPAWLVQQYIERPLLIHGHKFDIRVWALLTHDYRVYLYRDGVCRLAAAPFVASTFAGADFEFAHLTNHCIAARHPDYGRIAPGNEMFFDAFDAYLQSSPLHSASTSSASSPPSADIPSGRSVANDLMPQICSVLALAFESVRDLMQPPPDARVASFQRFGFDLMLEADFHLWLLEVNATPAVAAPLLERLVADLIELAIRPAFQTSDDAASERTSASALPAGDANGALARWLEVPLSPR